MSDASDTLVVLVHGFCRGAGDLENWRRRIKEDFAHVEVADLPATCGDFEDCVAELTRQTEERFHAADFGRLMMAGHSMGGLFLREYLARRRPANAVRAVCVATPYYGTLLADIAAGFPGAAAVWKPLRALRRASRKSITVPELPGLTMGNIVGTVNGHWPGKLFLSKASDGLVEIASAHAPDAAAEIQIAMKHNEMQFSRLVADKIALFLKQGNFEE